MLMHPLHHVMFSQTDADSEASQDHGHTHSSKQNLFLISLTQNFCVLFLPTFGIEDTEI